MADAINFPLHMEGRGEESRWWSDDEAHALWLLWLREDVERLREYLREHFNLGPDIDPINSGNIRITPDMLEELESRGIRPYVFRQRTGQAVIIPALTPHYVRLYADHSLFKLIWLFHRLLI